ncbi:MAG: hypothetical protein LUI13_09445 [Lachnospiraceae bacterium]|nr:hypothetical protein [Lachnospiraceae bacterium]
MVSISLCVILYFIFLFPTTFWTRRETKNFETLDITARHLIGFVFPLALYVAVRQSVFVGLASLSQSLWIHLELLQLAILACYNGTVAYEAKNNEFSLNILIPIVH